MNTIDAHDLAAEPNIDALAPVSGRRCRECGASPHNKRSAGLWTIDRGAARCNECSRELGYLDAPAPVFQLANDAPKPQRPAPEPKLRERQKPLFSGLDCLPGQADLFATDGETA